MNGAKRAVTSPARLIGLLFFVGYNLLWLPRAIMPRGGTVVLPWQGERIAFPPISVVDAVLFGVFSVASLFLLTGVFSPKSTFRAADVDVLFPTPVDPRTVMMFRLVRDYALTLLVPLLFLIVLWRPASSGWDQLFTGIPDPGSAGHVLRVGSIAYLLLSLAWLTVSYALAIYLYRADGSTERLRRVGAWLFGLVSVGALAGAMWWFVNSGGDWTQAIALAHAWPIRALLFIPTAATELTMAPLTGEWWLAFVGGGGLLLVIAVSVIAALRQAPYLYEQSALRSQSTAEAMAMQKKGDVYGLIAARARQGQVKAGRTGWLARQSWTGWRALLWKEALMFRRTTFGLLLMWAVLLVGISALLGLAPSGRRGAEAVGLIFLFMSAMLAFMPAAIAQTAFMDSLRRIDLMKPLPFRSATILRAELMGKVMPTSLLSVLGPVAYTIARPDGWPYAVAGAILMPALSYAFGSVFLLVVLLLPDIEDPTQRSFRGLVSMLGVFLFALPPLGVFALLMYFGLSAPLAAVPTALVTLALAFLTTWLASRLYDQFNPAE